MTASRLAPALTTLAAIPIFAWFSDTKTACSTAVSFGILVFASFASYYFLLKILQRFGMKK